MALLLRSGSSRSIKFILLEVEVRVVVISSSTRVGRSNFRNERDDSTTFVSRQKGHRLPAKSKFPQPHSSDADPLPTTIDADIQ
jgi:hypothetical protein